MDQSVIPECYVDTNLIETLVPPLRQYNHQKGCGTVTKVMKEKFSDRFALGIIDKDKVTVDYLKEFDSLIQDGSLILHKHRNKHHYIIQISPAIERFILECAGQVGVNLEDFDLPTEFNLLKKASKTLNSKSDQRFKRLFRQIRLAGSPQFEKLAAWISYLKLHPYTVNLDDLR